VAQPAGAAPWGEHRRRDGPSDLHGEQPEGALAHRGGLEVVAEHFGEDGRGLGGGRQCEHVVDGVAIEGLEALAIDGEGNAVERGHAITVWSPDRHHWR